jgi:hypothetical protein
MSGGLSMEKAPGDRRYQSIFACISLPRDKSSAVPSSCSKKSLGSKSDVAAKQLEEGVE